MRQVVGGRAVDAQAASASQMGRFETGTLAMPENRVALADLSGQWIDRFHDRRGLKYITLDMDSSVSPTHGEQEGTAWNGHFDCTCYHPLFVFNQFGMLERCALRHGNVHSAEGPSWPEAAYLGYYKNNGGTNHSPELCRYITTFSTGILSSRAGGGASLYSHQRRTGVGRKNARTQFREFDVVAGNAACLQ